jgi:FkbM family methyltransferase
MFSLLKKIIKRAPFLGSFLKWLQIETLVRFRDKSGYTRIEFARKLQKLSLFIAKKGMVGGLFTESGDFYIKTPDNFYLYYNYRDEKYTFGDGQSLDFSASYQLDRVEEFFFRCIRNGGVYFDVGANNGYYYSLKIAKQYSECKVYSFEPDAHILYHLRKNAAFNGLDNIEIVPQALSSSVERARMTAGLGASGYLIRNNADPIKSVEVECNTLDNFVEHNNIGRIDLIKVDVEGGEYEFLKGARKCVAQLRPILLLELREELLNRSAASVNQVVSFLINCEYKCFYLSSGSDALCIPLDKLHVLRQTDLEWLEEIKFPKED